MHMHSPKPRHGKKKSAEFGSDDWIDISVPASDGTGVEPGSTPARIFRLRDMDKAYDYGLSVVSMPFREASPPDSPSHLTKLKNGIDKMPLSAAVGNVRVIEIEDEESIKLGELRPNRIRKGERILFKTKNSQAKRDDKPLDEKYVHLSFEAARYLLDRRVQTVGVDYQSKGGYEGNVSEVHRIILNAGIWVIEGLDLSRVEPGDYELVCLPIRTDNSEGAPARVLLRPV
jgi:arylformamidase